jgi:PEP-CTERM motif
MNRRLNRGTVNILTLSFTTLTTSAYAQSPSLFATFGQATSEKSFTFTPSASGASFGLSSAIPVNFQYQATNSLGPVGINIPALLTMSSVNQGSLVTEGGFLIQPLQNIEMRFTSLSAPSNVGDLLRLSLTTGNLITRPGSQTASLTGTESPTGGSVVNFASDYLDFSVPLQNKNFSISLTSVEPRIADGGNGFLAPFVATGTGNFGSSPLPPPKNQIPEPGTLALVALGGLLFARRRKPTA